MRRATLRLGRVGIRGVTSGLAVYFAADWM
jgi:hypothetical protein